MRKKLLTGMVAMVLVMPTIGNAGTTKLRKKGAKQSTTRQWGSVVGGTFTYASRQRIRRHRRKVKTSSRPYSEPSKYDVLMNSLKHNHL